MEPVITLSHTVLSMAPACGGDVVNASVFASNVSTTEQVREGRRGMKRGDARPHPTISFRRCGACAVTLPPRRMRIHAVKVH